MDVTYPVREFTNTLFPLKVLKALPGLKKVSVYARRFDYEIMVNEEKKDMKLVIKGFTGKEIDFRVSCSPVKWGGKEWQGQPEPKWFIYENNSSSLAFADDKMEYCICAFLYLAGNLGKRELLKRIRENKRKVS